MAGYAIAETIDRLPDEVFAWLLDLEHRHQWVPGLVSVEVLTPAPLGAGGRWREQRRLGSRAGSAEVEVSTCEPPGDGRAPPFRVSLSRPAGRGRITQHFELTPEGDKSTRVSLRGEVVGGFGSFGLGRSLAREDADLLLRLKSAVETNGLWP